MDKTVSLNLVDVVKLLMSFAVIAIHSYVLNPSQYLHPIIEYLVNLAVPFFMVCTGYLCLKQNAFDKGKRYFKMYLKWIIIYLPLIVISYIHQPFSLDTFCEIGRKLVLTGTLPWAYHLWYILAVAVAFILLYGALNIGLPPKKISVGGLFLFGIGWYLQDWDGVWCDYYRQIFETSSNGFTFGLVLLSFGMILHTFSSKLKLLGVICISLSILMYVFDIYYYRVFGGGGLFAIAASIQIPSRDIYYKIRRLSTWIYFIHMYPLFILMTIQLKGVFIFDRWLGFVIVLILTTLLSYIIMQISYRVPVINNLLK